MDQLIATFGIDWRLLLVQSVNFGLLLLVLWKFVYRPVLAMIDTRRDAIAEGVRKAEAADRRLAEADAEGKQLVGDAAREGEAIVTAARTRAEEKASELLKEAQDKAAATAAEATERAAEAKRRALVESEQEIARAAVLAAEKIMRDRK
jgi:F-type H+-transporting ATPase subunit b